MRAREHLTRASELRRRIREADDSVSEMELRHLCDDARYETDNVRLLGDLAFAAFFEGSKPKQREDLRRQFTDAVQRGEMHGYLGWLDELRRKEPPLAPFHWEIEFLEVFDRGNPGFDAVVGNPPFLGGKRISTTLGDGYRDWLATLHTESNSNSDVVAHFFRRAFGLLRAGGTLGLIATNTIAQGDTRLTGLRWISKNDGEIYRAQRRVKWPGLAAVVVSVLHMHKGDFPGVKLLENKAMDRITAFLFHRGGDDDPARLEANAGKSFVGSFVLGMGFTFNDAPKKGTATPLVEMHRLIDAESRIGSSMKDDLRYTPSDCFETFPFPDEWSTRPDLERAGTDYYDYRADLMIRHDEGLTKTYNRFHDPEETSPDIVRLRDLHAAMDRAVLDAYGWTDIPTDSEFLLDYEIDEEDWGTRKKPYRHRWPDDVRDEVLARLLELNSQRFEAEQRAGGGARTTSLRAGTRRRRVRAARNAPEAGPAPGTLWNDNPLDGTHSGGTPDGTET